MGGPYLRMKELAEYLQLSPSTIYDLVNPDSERFDKTFPARIQFGQRAVGWSKPEVDEWCRKQEQKVRVARVRDAGLQVKPKKPRRSELKQSVTLAPPPIAEWEHMVKAQARDSYLLNLLGQKTWTPVMAALLANGYETPLGCTEIHRSRERLDGELFMPNYNMRTSVTSILEKWKEYIEDQEANSEATSTVDPLLISMSPIEFLIWFDDEEIDTPWVRLIRRLAGCPVQDDPQSFNLITINTPTTVVNPLSQSSCTSDNSERITETTRNGENENCRMTRAFPKNISEATESIDARRQRLRNRRTELKRDGVRNFNQTIAREEELSVTRIKQLLTESKKLRDVLSSTISQITASNKKSK